MLANMITPLCCQAVVLYIMTVADTIAKWRPGQPYEKNSPLSLVFIQETIPLDLRVALTMV